MTELAQLVGEDAEHLWAHLDYHKLYYKDGLVYGIIGITFENDSAVIFSKAGNNEAFTRGMLRDIIKLYQKMSVVLITDQESSFETIRNALDRYGFHNEIIYEPIKLLVSTHIKDKK